MKSICFIANRYPNVVEPNGLVFVQQLIWTIADKGIECVVICPLAINLHPKYRKVAYHVEEKTEHGNLVHVYFPKYFGLGQSHYILGKSLAPSTTHLFTETVKRTIFKNELSFDAVYGHFITPAGICAARIGRARSIPAFLAYGESTTWSIDQFGEESTRNELKSISGIIAVSSYSKKLLEQKNMASSEIISVFPNGYRPERFFPRNKRLSRARYGWNEKQFIVGFVGSFDERKGVLRLQSAVQNLENVYFACVGEGALIPNGEKCIFASPVNNDELPAFYSAIDVFALPTLNEGCCNAIIEAMACGCPIISSNRGFNDDILDDQCSIRIDPENIWELSEAIQYLHHDEAKRSEMGKASLHKAQRLTLSNRADNIIKFINEQSQKKCEWMKYR